MHPIAFDTETARIKPGRLAPPLTCITTARGFETKLHWVGDPNVPDHVQTWFTSPNILLIGHNVAYDLAVLAAEWPLLLGPIFAALEADRITDTGIRQKLIDIAKGVFRGYTEGLSQEYISHEYGLANLSERLLGRKMDKTTHRLGYGDLRNVHPDQWPAGAREYALGDARTTLDVFMEQEAERTLLDDQFRQTRAAFGFHLISCWGIRTSKERIDAFEAETKQAFIRAVNECRTAGLVRLGPKNKRDTKKARARMLELCKALDITPKRTKSFIQLKRKDESELTIKDRKNLADPLFGVSLDEEACLETGDALLKSYSQVSSLVTVVNSHIPALRNGTRAPIQPSFDPLVETGRGACKGHDPEKPTFGFQMHNVRRMPGIRECFVPRPGMLFLDADYDGLELRTWAQVCIWSVGYSRLAEVLNTGADPHLDLGAQLIGIGYEEARARYKASDERVSGARQFGKVGNFGFPGGMQPKTFRTHARQAFGLRMSEKESEDLYAAWQSNWPENRDYFAWIKAQCGELRLATVRHFQSNRFRGLIPYTVACNTFFQGLGADATKAALFALQRECFVDEGSPLFGCRVVNYVHDEFMLEVPDDIERSNAAAKRLVEVMVTHAGKWLPDVPPKATACLMREWSKNAKPVYQDGMLVPWEKAA